MSTALVPVMDEGASALGKMGLTLASSPSELFSKFALALPRKAQEYDQIGVWIEDERASFTIDMMFDTVYWHDINEYVGELGGCQAWIECFERACGREFRRLGGGSTPASAQLVSGTLPRRQNYAARFIEPAPIGQVLISANSLHLFIVPPHLILNEIQETPHADLKDTVLHRLDKKRVARFCWEFRFSKYGYLGSCGQMDEHLATQIFNVAPLVEGPTWSKTNALMAHGARQPRTYTASPNILYTLFHYFYPYCLAHRPSGRDDRLSR